MPATRCTPGTARRARAPRSPSQGGQPAASLEELVANLGEGRRAVWVMVPSGDVTEQTIDERRGPAARGRHPHRRRQLALHGRQAALGRAGRARHRVRRRRHLGRRLGLPGRLLPDGRRPRRGHRPPRPRPHRSRAARQRLAALRPGRRGALRQDGPQRHRVRPHAGLRRGLRDHARERVRPRRGRDRQALDAGLGRALVAARAARPGVRRGSRPRRASAATSRTPARAAGRSSRRSTPPCPRP